MIDAKAKKIIHDNLYMTISVCDLAGNPWIANVFFADGGGNFYWYSSKETRHSKLIKSNPNIAVAIFNSTATDDDVDAVYFSAQAAEVTDKQELLKGLLVYGQKMFRTKFLPNKAAVHEFVKGLADFQGKALLRLYKAVPEKMFRLAPSRMFNGKYIDSRVEVDFH